MKVRRYNLVQLNEIQNIDGSRFLGVITSGKNIIEYFRLNKHDMLRAWHLSQKADGAFIYLWHMKTTMHDAYNVCSVHCFKLNIRI